MTKEIQLSQGYVALVDDEDYEWLSQWKWTYHNGYAYRNITVPTNASGFGTQRMHRLILDASRFFEVDHIDGDGLNNIRSNLRLATRTQNSRNRRGTGYNGLKGIAIHKFSGLWQAKIRANAKQIHLGYFKTPEAAAHAYDAAARQYHGEFARLNFPEER